MALTLMSQHYTTHTLWDALGQEANLKISIKNVLPTQEVVK